MKLFKIGTLEKFEKKFKMKEGTISFSHTHKHINTYHKHKQFDVPYEKEHVCRDSGVVAVRRGKTFGECEKCSCLNRSILWFYRVY